MKKWKTKNGYEVYLVSSGRSNVYLISTPSENILVDTGWKYSYPGLKRNIKALGLSYRINLIILMHTHFDHCHNACILRQQENCMILAGEQEARFTKTGYTPIPAGTLILTRLLSGLGSLIGRSWFEYPSFTTDRLIGNYLDLSEDGFDIQLIATPGHSIGSVSVIINNEIAIVGDTMLGIFRNSIFTPFADDPEEMVRSWGKLLKTQCTLFLPGHGKAINRELVQRDCEKYSKKYNLNILQPEI